MLLSEQDESLRQFRVFQLTDTSHITKIIHPMKYTPVECRSLRRAAALEEEEEEEDDEDDNQEYKLGEVMKFIGKLIEINAETLRSLASGQEP